ncbi:glycosyltransferase family 4 protein [Candidatus Berkelbacteria bacterium]|nr:glycosyltransferase family 4 protein [Candidatus Berkelbacteria bacterium]
MKVLFQCRKNLNTYAGGDRVQILATQVALKKLGIEAQLSLGEPPALDGIDVVHVFNPLLVSARILKQAKIAGVPVVVSSIFWPMGEYFRAYKDFTRTLITLRPTNWVSASLEMGLRYLTYTYAWNPFIEHRLTHFLSQADLVLPNSSAEGEMIESRLKVKTPWRVVPNGIDPLLKVKKMVSLPSLLKKIKNYILCVGRLELRKNQHLLIQALSGIQVPLVLVGNRTVSPSYTRVCEKLARQHNQTYFIDHLPQEALPLVYQRARVHALPSWYETPGLASLEAALAGCRIVTTSTGGPREYFGKEAFYCQPNDPGSIKNAVLQALAAPISSRLQERIKLNYTWKQTAIKTLAGYRAAQR